VGAEVVVTAPTSPTPVLSGEVALTGSAHQRGGRAARTGGSSTTRRCAAPKSTWTRGRQL
jgi:hypothetical protein